MSIALGEIIEAAEAAAGIADTDTHLHVNLEHLLASLNTDGGLTEEGEALARRSLIARTTDRLRGLAWLHDYPEIGEAPVEAPVFLTGLPRSGTTAFQYLFDRDPRFRLIRTWEGLMPDPPPGADPASVIWRKAEEAKRRLASRPAIKGFAAMHLHDEDGPEECHAFMEQAYAAAGFFNLFDVPGYFDWLAGGCDRVAAYRLHKRQLQLLQWKMPQPRWALKYPNHALAMDDILSVYPDARFVMTHRDPVQVLASICKMTLMLRTSRAGRPADPLRIGRQMFGFIATQIERTLAFAAGPNAGRVVHVDYYVMLDRPADVIASVHQGLGMDTPDVVRSAVARWHQDNPKGARGHNAYTLEQFGLNDAEVAEAFGDYMGRFNVPREAEVLGGATPSVVFAKPRSG